MRVDRPPEVHEVLPVAVEYVRIPGNSVGGGLHIVLDDDNLEDHDLHWCRGWCDAQEDHEGALLAFLLAEMDVVDRVNLVTRDLAEARSYDDQGGSPRQFWEAVEATRFAGWGGVFEERITGYRRTM